LKGRGGKTPSFGKILKESFQKHYGVANKGCMRAKFALRVEAVLEKRRETIRYVSSSEFRRRKVAELHLRGELGGTCAGVEGAGNGPLEIMKLDEVGGAK